MHACGVARFAYNWALAEWRRQHKAGENPSEVALRKQLNSLKRTQFPWMLEVSKTVPQQAIKNLGKAYANFFKDIDKYHRRQLPWRKVRQPHFKKKYRRDAFRADNGTDRNRPNAVTADGKRVKLPTIGWVRMREEIRFAGRIISVTISRQGNMWFASFTIEVAFERDVRFDSSVIGVDLGIRALATLSDGTTPFPAPKPLGRYLKTLRRSNRAYSRKQRGSMNRAKAKAKLARLHRRIADIRADALHKLTTFLTQYRTIVIEDLNVAGLMANRPLARAIADIGFGEFRRQLGYKAAMAGSRVIVANRWFPSSKLCSSCGAKNKGLELCVRSWTCPSCGTSHDRDFNAARNLARYTASSAVSACRAGDQGGGDHTAANLPAKKQEVRVRVSATPSERCDCN